MSLLTRTLGLDIKQSPYRSNQQSALSNLGSLAPTYQSQATQGQGVVNQFLPQRTATGQALLNRQSQGFDAGGLLKSKMLSGLNTGYASAAANARVNAQRTGQNASPMLALLDAQKAGATVQGLNDYGLQKSALDMDYAKGAYNTASTLTGQGMAEQGQGLGNLSNLYSTQYQGYGNLAQQDEARQAAQNQMRASLVGSLASLFGGFAKAPGRITPQSLPDNANLGGEEFMPYNGMEAPQPDYSGILRLMPSLQPTVRAAAPRRNIY